MVFEKKSSNFKSLIFLFFILTFFISLFLNFHSYEDKLSNNIFFQMELSSGLDKENQGEFEKRILQFKNVKKVRYYSKEEGIKNLEKELNISLPSGMNSLPDILIAYVEDRAAAEEIINNLEDERAVTEFYLDVEKIERALLERKIFKLLKIMTVLFFIAPSVSVIFSLCYGMRERNLIYYYLTSRDRGNLQKKAKKVSLFPMIFSAAIGILFYLNLYVLLQNNLTKLGINFIVASPEMLSFGAAGLGILIPLLVHLSPYSKNYRGSRDE